MFGKRAALAPVLVLVLILLLPAPAARAGNAGEELLQCVTLAWEATATYPPSVRVEARVFGKTVAAEVLDLKRKDMEFAFEDGFLAAKGRVSAAFEPAEGKGELRLEALEASCDFSGSFPFKPRKLADLTFEPKFDY